MCVRTCVPTPPPLLLYHHFCISSASTSTSGRDEPFFLHLLQIMLFLLHYHLPLPLPLSLSFFGILVWDGVCYVILEMVLMGHLVVFMVLLFLPTSENGKWPAIWFILELFNDDLTTTAALLPVHSILMLISCWCCFNSFSFFLGDDCIVFFIFPLPFAFMHA